MSILENRSPQVTNTIIQLDINISIFFRSCLQRVLPMEGLDRFHSIFYIAVYLCVRDPIRNNRFLCNEIFSLTALAEIHEQIDSHETPEIHEIPGMYRPLIQEWQLNQMVCFFINTPRSRKIIQN